MEKLGKSIKTMIISVKIKYSKMIKFCNFRNFSSAQVHTGVTSHIVSIYTYIYIYIYEYGTYSYVRIFMRTS